MHVLRHSDIGLFRQEFAPFGQRSTQFGVVEYDVSRHVRECTTRLKESMRIL